MSRKTYFLYCISTKTLKFDIHKHFPVVTPSIGRPTEKEIILKRSLGATIKMRYTVVFLSRYASCIQRYSIHIYGAILNSYFACCTKPFFMVGHLLKMFWNANNAGSSLSVNSNTPHCHLCTHTCRHSLEIHTDVMETNKRFYVCDPPNIIRSFPLSIICRDPSKLPTMAFVALWKTRCP